MKIPSQLRPSILAATVGFSLFASLAGCDSTVTRTEKEYINDAKAAFTLGKFTSSVVQLKNALKQNPENPESRKLLGLTYLALGDGFAAEKELRTSLGFAADRAEIIIPLVEALQLQGKYERILEETGTLPDLSEADLVKVIAYKGDALLATKQSEKAAAEYERALQIDPTSASAMLGKTKVAVSVNDFNKGLTILKAALLTAPKEASLWRLQADLLARQGKLEEAEESYSKAINLHHLNRPDRANRAVIRIMLKKFEAAKEDVDILKQQASTYYLAHYANGLFKAHQEKFEEAQRSLETAVSLNNRFLPTYYLLGFCHLMQNNLAQAEQELRRFLSQSPDSVKGRNLLALTNFRQKEFETAKKILLPVINISNDNFSNTLMSAIEFGLGNEDKALEYLKTATENKPSSAISKYRQGLAKLKQGGPIQGLAEIEAALDIDPEITGAKAFMALAQIQAKQFDKAWLTIEALRKSSPGDATSANLTGILYLAKGKASAARRSFKEALALVPGNPIAALYLADMHIAREEFDAALSLYDQVLKENPGHLSATLRLAELYFRGGRTEEMESLLRKVLAKSPDTLEVKLVLARYYIQYGQPNRAVALLKSEVDAEETRSEVLSLITEAYLAAKEPESALESAKQLVSNFPNSAHGQYLLAQTYSAVEDTANMRDALLRSREIDPKFFRTRLALVKLLVLEQNDSEAAIELMDLSTQFPENTDVLELQGWVAIRQGNYRLAIEAFSKALNQRPNSTLAFNLARAQWDHGQKDAAVRTLENWNQQYPNDTVVRYLLSGFYRELGNSAALKKQLAKILEARPDNYLALNDLAWEIQNDDALQSLKYAEKATNLAPDNPAVLDTFGMVLLKNGQNQQALEVIQKAHRLAESNLSIRYHLAILQKANNQPENAIKTLKEIIQENRDFPEKKEAEALLSELSG